MKTPNVLSLVAMLAVVLPSIAFAITQQFPETEYWWAALATGVIGAIVKALEVWLGNRAQGEAEMGAREAAPAENKPAVRRWLAG